MKTDTRKHHRRSIRLKNYDYSQPGGYFITICTQNRECYFGHIKNGSVVLSPMGEMAHHLWLEIPRHFDHVKIDAFIVMPNHVHGILMIHDNYRRGTTCRAPPYEKFGNPRPGSIPTVVRSYKSAVTRWCHKNGYEYFQWQRNYYEHIIRNGKGLNDIKYYVINNPLKWEEDRNNPKNIEQ